MTPEKKEAIKKRKRLSDHEMVKVTIVQGVRKVQCPHLWTSNWVQACTCSMSYLYNYLESEAKVGWQGHDSLQCLSCWLWKEGMRASCAMAGRGGWEMESMWAVAINVPSWARLPSLSMQATDPEMPDLTALLQFGYQVHPVIMLPQRVHISCRL